MSKITEFANCAVKRVSTETDIPEELIISKSRVADIVDVRHLVIKLLHSKGIYPSRIAEMFNLSTRTIHYIITTFDDRMQSNKTLRKIFTKVSQHLDDDFETIWK